MDDENMIEVGDAITFWTSKSVIEWLEANTNETDIIVVKEGTDEGENPNPVIFDFTIGAVEQDEFIDLFDQIFQDEEEES